MRVKVTISYTPRADADHLVKDLSVVLVRDVRGGVSSEAVDCGRARSPVSQSSSRGHRWSRGEMSTRGSGQAIVNRWSAWTELEVPSAMLGSDRESQVPSRSRVLGECSQG